MNNIPTENNLTNINHQPTVAPLHPITAETEKARRKRLISILEEFEVPADAFDALRADSYEKHIAQRSLTELERVYGTLLKATEGYEAIQDKFPRWGKDSKHEGKLPSTRTLSEIRQRIRAEHVADKLEQSEGFMDRLKNQLAAGPTIPEAAPIIPNQPGAGLIVQNEKVEAVDVIISLMTEELLAAKLDGKGLSPGMLDRVLRAMNQRTRNRLAERKLALQERAEQRELERERAEQAANRPPREMSHAEYQKRFNEIYGCAPEVETEVEEETLPPVEEPGQN